jgi:hypothetical protein
MTAARSPRITPCGYMAQSDNQKRGRSDATFEA